MTWVYCSALMQIDRSPVDVQPWTLVVLETKVFFRKHVKLGSRRENNKADISSNLNEFWMVNSWVIAEHERAIQPAGCIFRWAMLHAMFKGVLCGDVPDVGPARPKSSSKLANLVLIWCRLNVGTGKKIYIAPFWGHIVELFARTEARGAPYSMTWVYCYTLMQIECSQVDVPPYHW